jgi:hypothetical protein
MFTSVHGSERERFGDMRLRVVRQAQHDRVREKRL